MALFTPPKKKKETWELSGPLRVEPTVTPTIRTAPRPQPVAQPQPTVSRAPTIRVGNTYVAPSEESYTTSSFTAPKPRQSFWNKARDVLDANTEADQWRRQISGREAIQEAPGNIISNTIGAVPRMINTASAQIPEIIATGQGSFASMEYSRASEEYNKAIRSGNPAYINAAKEGLARASKRVSDIENFQEGARQAYKTNSGGLFNAGTLYNAEEAKRGDLKTGATRIGLGTAEAMFDVASLGLAGTSGKVVAKNVAKQGFNKGVQTALKNEAKTIGKNVIANTLQAGAGAGRTGASAKEIGMSMLAGGTIGTLADVGLAVGGGTIGSKFAKPLAKVSEPTKTAGKKAWTAIGGKRVEDAIALGNRPIQDLIPKRASLRASQGGFVSPGRTPKNVHPDDVQTMTDFIDYNRGVKQLTPQQAYNLELDASRIAEYYGIPTKGSKKTAPETRLANAFDERIMTQRQTQAGKVYNPFTRKWIDSPDAKQGGYINAGRTAETPEAPVVPRTADPAVIIQKKYGGDIDAIRADVEKYGWNGADNLHANYYERSKARLQGNALDVPEVIDRDVLEVQNAIEQAVRSGDLEQAQMLNDTLPDEMKVSVPVEAEAPTPIPQGKARVSNAPEREPMSPEELDALAQSAPYQPPTPVQRVDPETGQLHTTFETPPQRPLERPVNVDPNTGEILDQPFVAETPDTPLGTMAQDFYEGKKGNQAIRFRDLENLGKQISREADRVFKNIGSDFQTVARKTQEAFENGARSLDEVDLTPAEKDLWRGVQNEMDYVRRRGSLGTREISEGDFGELYFPRQTADQYATRESLFQGFRDTRPGNEIRRGKGETAINIDEASYSPDVIGSYVTRYGDTKLLQEDRIIRALQKQHPDMPAEQLQIQAQKIIDLQNRVNSLKTKIGLGGAGRKVTVSGGKHIDFADEMSVIGRDMGNAQIQVADTPRGLTNGDRINSVSIDDGGKLTSVADYLGLNQLRDSSTYAGTQIKRATSKEDLVAMVDERLRTNYKLADEDIEYLTNSLMNMKDSLPEDVVRARVEGVYRNAAKQQMMEQMQNINITNKTLRKDVSDLANQILREGTIERQLSSKVVSGALRGTNALFRKFNIGSALNELSDLSSFLSVYGKNTKVFTPDFKLIKEMGLGDLDPALEPYLKQIEAGTPINKVMKGLKSANEASRFYKFVETYKAGVLLKTARDFYAGQGLTGDALTKKVLEDYRQLALPVDQFTKTFLDSAPLWTQYMSWGARNIQKEGKLLTGQIDSGVLKDKSTAQRIARNAYANVPAKSAFWLASNGLKGTALLSAFGLTDFTGLTTDDYSGINPEDKSNFDKTTEFTNSSTVASMINSFVQEYEKEQLKKKYADADYNPYEDTNIGESLVNKYTPQFIKNIAGARELQEKGYSENKAGRVQYEAPTDPWNTFKSYVFGKGQTANAREYSGRENIVDRLQEGKNPLQAVQDMAKEQLNLQETDYNRPLTEDYSTKYKATEQGARTALLQGGRQYNDYLDDLKKNQPDLYNNYISAMDSNHVSPEFWRNISSDPNGGQNLTTFKMMRDRKKQLLKDLGTGYDPIYDLPDDQAAQVLKYQSSPTGDDLALRNVMNKEQWYKDLKERRKEFYAANPKDDTSGDYATTARVDQWNALEDQLDDFFYDKESKEVPAWASQFPMVYRQKQINDQFGFDSQQSKDFFRSNADAYQAQKDEYDKAQLAVINQMRAIEGFPEMSFAAYQQATEIADTDGEDKKYGGGGGSYLNAPQASFGQRRAINLQTANIKVPKIKLKPRGGAKKITVKRGGRI